MTLIATPVSTFLGKRNYRRGCIAALFAGMMISPAFASREPWVELPAFPKVVEDSSPYIRPAIGQALQLDVDEMRKLLLTIPVEVYPIPENEGVLIELPHPNGGFTRFRVVESPIMEKELADKFPDIKTYRGQGVDDPAANIRFDLTPLGFHAMVLSPSGDYYIDPYNKDDVNHYTAYYKRNYLNRGAHRFFCEATGEGQEVPQSGYASRASGSTLRNYRLAVSATGEYTAFFGGTVANGQAAIVTAVNRVTGLYERDLCIRLTLVANNNLLVYTNASTDPFTNSSGTSLLGENQTTTTNVIGTANYDIGHVFSTGGGGVAGLGVVCVTGQKARGVTGSGSPVGDPFYIDYVAHEMGHQFGAAHSFNGTGGACSGNRSSSSAYEPGSGSTIMSYAGICNADDLQPNSDAAFHARSYAQIRTFITTGSGTCGTNIATGNIQPSVNGGPNYTIPINTPFAIGTASATDANGDTLTYSWEEMDLGAAQTLAATDNGTSPIFRAWTPAESNIRTFPRYSNVLNQTLAAGEEYPVVGRTMNLRINVRDNRSGGGGVIEDDVALTINAASGPFRVTSPNTALTWATGAQTVTWDVASTSASPVNAANVRILLSTDGGISFPYTLLASTPNDGSQAVTIPDVNSTQSRIRIEAVGNIFFDVSNVNFSITGTPPPSTPTSVSVSPSSFCAAGTTVTLTGTVNAGETIDWYTGSCGGTLIGSGSPLNVTANATTQYFARARRVSGGAVSNSCASATATLSGGGVGTTTVSAADGVACTALSVTWTTVSGATSYEVYRNTTNNSATATLLATDNASPYSDTTAVIGTSYYYFVKAIGACGAGAFSAGDPGSLRLPLASPTGLSANAACGGSVALSWATVSGNSGYQVFRNTENNSTTATFISGTLITSYTDTTAPTNVTLYYWVRTLNACGPGPADSMISTTSPSAPSATTGVEASTSNCNLISLTWSETVGATGYEVLRGTDANPSNATSIGSVAVLTFNDAAATPGVTYYYFVRGTNSCGSGTLSNVATGTRPAAAPPAPTGITAASTCDSVNIDWNTSAGATTYDVLRGLLANGSDASVLTSVGTNSYSDSSASAGTTYYYFVRAVGACGQSANSSGAAGSRFAAPQTPAGVSASNNNCAQVTVSWMAAADATSYEVLRALAVTPANTAVIGTTVSTSYDDTSAVSSESYVYYVRSVGNCPNPALSASAAGTRPSLAAPTNVAAADATSCSGVLVSWNAQAGAQSYAVLRNITNNAAGAAVVGTTSNTSYDDATATPGTMYYYFVVSQSAGCGDSAPSTGDSGLAGTAPSIGTQPQSQTVNPGESAALGVVASGTSITYVWYKDGSPVVADPPRLTGEANAVLMFTETEQTDAGEYYVRIISECGTIESEVATLTIGEPYCPADFNQDGGIDGADVEFFFEMWSQGDPSADVNFDGGVDGSDVEDFFNAWSAGGC